MMLKRQENFEDYFFDVKFFEESQILDEQNRGILNRKINDIKNVYGLNLARLRR